MTTGPIGSGMTQITVDVHGVPEVVGWFDRYNKELVKRLSYVVEETSRNIEAGAVMRAPWQSGRLARSIGHRLPWGYSAKNPAPEYELGRVIRATAWYGPLVEFGIGRLGQLTAASNPPWLKRNLFNRLPFMQAPGRLSKATRRQGIGTQLKARTQLAAAGGKFTALSYWARRTGYDPWAVAKGIQRRGGVRARPFLGPAWEEEKPTFIDRVRTTLLEAGQLAKVKS